MAKLTCNPRVVMGLIILGVAAALALWPQLFAPYDPSAQDVNLRLKPPGWSDGNGVYVLGTDPLGRDVLSRLIFGARISLLIGLTSVCISAPVGVTVGLLSGYVGGRLDDLVMRLADIHLAFPMVLLAVTFVAVLGPSIGVLTVVLGLSGWVLYARIVRGEVLKVRRLEYVEAARATGARDNRILWRHVLPNVVSPVIVVATFQVAQIILLEATLSFLGLGVQPPTPTWGGMLNDSRNYLTVAWWLGIFPGLAIMLVVLSINFVGDWLRDVLDPRLQV